MEQIISNGVTYDVVGYRRPFQGEYYLHPQGISIASTHSRGPEWWVVKPVKWEPKEGEFFWHVWISDGSARVICSSWSARCYLDNADSGNVYQYQHLADVTANKINSIFQESL
jgi:hypothetical protein